MAFRNALVLLGAYLPAILAAPVEVPAVQAREAVPNKYIVTLKSDVDVDSHLTWVAEAHKRSLNKRDTVGIEHTYGFGDFHAYAGEFDEATLEEIKNNPEV